MVYTFIPISYSINELTNYYKSNINYSEIFDGLDSNIKNDLEMLPDIRMRRHNPTGMVFNKDGKVVGKYYWNPDGFEDYSELTDEDVNVCVKHNFLMAYKSPPPPPGFTI